MPLKIASEWVDAIQPEPLHIGVLVALFVFVTVLFSAGKLRSRDQVRRRATASDHLNIVVGGKDPRALGYRNEQRVSRLMVRAGQLFAPNSKDNIKSIRKQLVQAGFLSQAAVPIFYTIRVFLAVALPLFLLLFTSVLPFEVPAYLVLAIALGLAVAGLILPAILLDQMRSAMRNRYRQAFPELLDLLVVCLEAGQSLDGAIERVGKEIVQSCAELGANMYILSLELRAGRSLTEALDGLHERLGIEEVKSLKLLLKQSEELGASIATTMRVYSDEMRDKRLMRAEAKAHALPAKMTIPLGLFIFPVILILIMVPLVIRIGNAFG